jgi:hypothetical protein
MPNDSRWDLRQPGEDPGDLTCRGPPAVFISITVSIVWDIIAAAAVPSAFGVPGGPNRHVGAAAPEGLSQPPVDNHLLAEKEGEHDQGGRVQKMDEHTHPIIRGEADHPEDDQHTDEI